MKVFLINENDKIFKKKEKLNKLIDKIMKN